MPQLGMNNSWKVSLVLLAKLLTAKSYETLQHIATPAMISVVQVFESLTIISNDNNIFWWLSYRLTKQHVSLLFDLWQYFCVMAIVLFHGNSFILWQ